MDPNAFKIYTQWFIFIWIIQKPTHIKI